MSNSKKNIPNKVSHTSDSILKIEQISKTFGGIKAVDRFSLKVERGLIHSLIGPNGAGKTTLINMISGIYSLDSGRIFFLDEEITNLPINRLVEKSIVRTFQNLEVCHNMSVLENILLGYNLRMNKNLIKCSLGFKAIKDDEERFTDAALALLEKVGIADLSEIMCGELPYGVLKKVEIVRSLATDPKLLLLDEPVAGLNTRETKEISTMIQDISKEGVTIILVEHDMQMVMDISDRVTVVNFGVKIAEGTPQEVATDPRVINAYLGKGDQ